MALDQEDLQWISSDLSNLSKFETEEAISGRKAELGLNYFGYEWASADVAKEAAKRRLLILPSWDQGLLPMARALRRDSGLHQATRCLHR